MRVTTLHLQSNLSRSWLVQIEKMAPVSIITTGKAVCFACQCDLTVFLKSGAVKNAANLHSHHAGFSVAPFATAHTHVLYACVNTLTCVWATCRSLP